MPGRPCRNRFRPRSRPTTCAPWPQRASRILTLSPLCPHRRCRKWPIRSGFSPCSIWTPRWRLSASWSTSRARSGPFAPELVRTLGFPYSISATFLERNQRQTLQQARQTLERICSQASQAGLGVVAYLSMAFGNPYGDPWRQEDVIDACLTLKGMGIEQISLADTVGVATPGQIHSLVSAVLAEILGIELGAHLHARPEQAALEGRSGLPGGLPPPGYGAGWPGRLSLRPGRAGRQCGDRGSFGRATQARCESPPVTSARRIAGDGACHR